MQSVYDYWFGVGFASGIAIGFIVGLITFLGVWIISEYLEKYTITFKFKVVAKRNRKKEETKE